MSFCKECGAKVSSNQKFCPKCGGKINVPNSKKQNVSVDKLNHSNKSNVDGIIFGIINKIISQPKLIIAIILSILIIFGLANLFSDDYSGGYAMDISGLSFSIPDGFVESYHKGPNSVGETVDFHGPNYDDLEIRVSPGRTPDLSSNHIKSQFDKIIDGKDGVVVLSDSNRTSFYYYEGNDLVCLNTNSPDYEDLFKAVII